ncbi:MAG TPA: 50S ribosomal protein L29 [Acidobacteriota bacterium]|jgi:large subunit ribosomal protein L29|nr:50S ribosomal protein L29 [Acidobacteriota bacterium]
MKASKMREMSVTELSDEAREMSKQLFQLRLQKATGQLDNVNKIREIRKDLARVKTVLTEKEENNG